MMSLDTLLQAVGGLGLFLLGMVTMTDSLKKLAGDKLRLTLFEFTKTPTTGAATGAITTAIVQSSSATTVAAVGFVGAGLMTFPNALGIIFGANIGTTVTGWMVALLGFKLSIDNFAFPMVFIGVFLKLFAPNRLATIGLALAGFGLLFIGLDHLQTGMHTMQELFDFTQLHTHNLMGLLKLVLIGFAFTLVTQSSSAGVAVTLTALFSGMIEFEQAAALVIGMDIGTTVTSLIASLGGTVGAKRTGLSHVVYNLITACIALVLITPYIAAINWLIPNATTEHAELALVGFHSFFNIIGVMAILPFSKQFATLLETLVPDNDTQLTKTLDNRLLTTPDLALLATTSTLNELHIAILHILHKRLKNEPVSDHTLSQLQLELDKTQRFLDKIELNKPSPDLWKKLTAQIHALDHLQRLHERCEEDADRAAMTKNVPTLSTARQKLIHDIPKLIDKLSQRKFSKAGHQTLKLYQFIDSESEAYRNDMVEKMGRGEVDATHCTNALEAVRWIKRVSHHLHKINHHIKKSI